MIRDDPITFELVKNGLSAIVDEMALTMVRTAYSANLKKPMDLSTAFCATDGQLLAQGLTLPLHLGSIPDALAAVRARYGNAIRPGDVFILNDPYEGGTHLPDLFVIEPVFVPVLMHENLLEGVDGHGEHRLAGFVATCAHHSDIGGRVAGGNACDSTEIYQEGLRIPPLRLYDRGTPDEALFRLLEANVRVPVMVLGDLRAQLAACHIGKAGLHQLVTRYGLRTLEGHFRALLDHTERLARAAIARWPDGRYTFTDFIDDDGIDAEPIPITVAIIVDGDTLVADFTGTAPQVKGAINSPLPFTKSAVYACVRCLMEPDIPNNEGYFRPIRVRAPAGTVVNPVLPAPVAARGLTGFRLANVLMGALAQLAPEQVPAAEVGGDTGITFGGYDARRRPFVFLEFLFGSWGRRPDRDGVDGNSSIVRSLLEQPDRNRGGRAAAPDRAVRVRP